MSSTPVSEVINVTYTSTPGFPAGSVLAAITATFVGSIAGNNATASVTLNAPTITVPLIPDTYTWTLTNMDASNNTFGGPFTGTGVVAAPATATLNLATGLSFT
jgi:hypothetical protein